MARPGERERGGNPTTSLGLPRRFVWACIFLGLGLGGFADGIVLHQILQWHHMLTAEGSHPSDTVAGLETNTLWDGLFHAFTWFATVVGVGLLWQSRPLNGKGWGWALIGLCAVGWGLFNVVEGVIDHHLLTIHHVRDDVDEPLPWDLAFLALGAALIIGGGSLWRHGLSLVRDVP